MSFEQAAGFPIVYGTSHVGLQHRARLQPSETLLVHGAAGGVGLSAVELGKAMGASVIACASSDEKLAVCKQAGADHTINYASGEFKDQVKKLTKGNGANVIYDPVGGDVLLQSLRCVAWEGRILVIGFASGQIPAIPANLILIKNCAVMGHFWGAYQMHDPGVIRRSFTELLDWYSQGKLHPHVSATFPLAEAARAMRALTTRTAIGKVVLVTT
jgi:NADPH2:quinone reductase